MARRMLLMVFLLSIAGTALAGCGSSTTALPEHELAMAPMSMMPDDVKSAPPLTQQAYQFAVANPDVMQHVPCYCGCVELVHTSNYDCYVKSVKPDGQVTFDSHATNCEVCIDITQDVMRLFKQGDSTARIKAYIDKNYARYGASTGP